VADGHLNQFAPAETRFGEGDEIQNLGAGTARSSVTC
jgi:hypothetical protein